ncbi:MAG: hypothetical protein ACE148_14430 [Vicinamibacterales bacterium]
MARALDQRRRRHQPFDPTRPCHHELPPHVRLGLAVLGQALTDLSDPRPHVRSDACTFFASEWLEAWADVANVDPRLVRGGVTAYLRSSNGRRAA